jgi:hypothetical protein
MELQHTHDYSDEDKEFYHLHRKMLATMDTDSGFPEKDNDRYKELRAKDFTRNRKIAATANHTRR